MPLFTSFAGKFITFEGIEGVGKTTNIRYVADLINQITGIETVISREPGGTPMAEAIRKILLAHYQETVLAETETLLLFAGRAQHVQNIIVPALQAGKCVLCDRFTDATYAYQGGGRGISLEFIKSLEKMVQGELRPDLTLVFDLPVSIGLDRAKGRGASDRFEAEELDFFERVRAAYLTRAKFNDKYQVIDASQPLTAVQQHLRELLF